ncbi:MAG: hypothetical protein HXY50_09335 [Ignavibacteriaceae bacterium]|nr:hypothetical protein [Ignavibacteriaceae bacterium]
MKPLNENIRELIEQIIAKDNLLLIELILRGTEHNRVIEVFIDGERDISADDCANISNKIDVELQILLAQFPNYRLDVSSPGIDRPLKYLKQYYKHINRKFDIIYGVDEEKRKLAGKLVSIEGEYLTFVSNNKEVIINFNNIIKANVVVSFS